MCGVTLLQLYHFIYLHIVKYNQQTYRQQKFFTKWFIKSFLLHTTCLQKLVLEQQHLVMYIYWIHKDGKVAVKNM